MQNFISIGQYQCKLSNKYANTLFKYVNLAVILKRMKPDCHPTFSFLVTFPCFQSLGFEF